MKSLQSIVAASILAFAATAHAGYDDYEHHDSASYTDWARVTRVTPQYERVKVARQRCRTEYLSEHDEYREEGRSYGGAIIGGIAGGILGNQVGRGDGRKVATAAGAVVGAIVGDRIDNGGYRPVRNEPMHREVQRCRTVHDWEDRLTGYQVEYEYHGRHYTRFMTEEPGRRFRVRVSVTPA